MSYETLIFYSVVTSVITLDRVDLKKKVVDAPEILTVIDSIPNLMSFLNSLYMCQYGAFFKVCANCRLCYFHASKVLSSASEFDCCSSGIHGMVKVARRETVTCRTLS